MFTIKCKFNDKQADDVCRSIAASSELIGDMTPLWEKMVKPISQRIARNFNDQGNFKGAWEELDKKYLAWKRKQGLSTRILEATGRLKASATVKDAPDNICYIDTKKFIWGSAVPYGIYHDSDKPRTKLPWREFMILDPETVNSIITRAIAAFVRSSGLATGVLKRGK